MELLIAPFEERLKQPIWESFTDKFYLCLKQFALALFFCRILANRKLRWPVGLKLIQLEQQKTTFFHYFSKKIKTNTLQGHKRNIKNFELQKNNLCLQKLTAKLT